jgi:parallel beta-helix repeat protein
MFNSVRNGVCSLAFVVLAFVASLLFCASAQAQQTINVPADQATIQAAINAANNGDTVLVAPGTYVENINFNGKAITVKSSAGPAATIIDGNTNGSVVTFNTNETTSSVLSGFTIRNGLSSFSSPGLGFGGGIYISGASPTITGNVITGNQAAQGTGIAVQGASPIIQNNKISENTNIPCCVPGGLGGGGILLLDTVSPQILNNLITNNTLDGAEGGGLTLYSAGTPTIQGNLISGNSVSGLEPAAVGGGMWIVNFSNPLIVQNIIVGNSADQGAGIVSSPSTYNGGSGTLLVNNTIANNNARQLFGSALQVGGTTVLFNNLIIGMPNQSAVDCGAGSPAPAFQFNDVFAPPASPYGRNCTDQTGQNGNISSDPLFMNVASSDFHLKQGSPAIDAGNNSAPNLPQTDYDGNPRIVDGNNDGVATVDLGAFELVPTSAANIAPNALSFSSQAIGTTSGPQAVTLTSTGTTPFQITSVQISGDFSQSSGTCLSAVPSGASCIYNVTFAPAAAGTRTGSLTVNGTNGTSLLVSLTGTAPMEATTTTVTSSNNPSTVGKSVTFTATVQPLAGNSPTGTVTFFDGATALGTINLSNSSAQMTVPLLTSGTHSITAQYSGDSTFEPSTSSVFIQTVNVILTTTTVTSSGNPSMEGQSVTFTANVQAPPVTPAGGLPTGTVTFFDGTATLGTATYSGMSAQLTTSALAIGTHSVTAKYSGDANYAGSTSSALTQTVTLIQTGTTVSSSKNPSTFGQSVIFTASVQISSGSSPTGTVTFFDGATALGTSTLSGSSAQLSTSALAIGSHTITAKYSGDSNFAGSTSPVLTETVNPIPTATTVSSSNNPSTLGQGVTFTANVQIGSGSSPTGTVMFLDGTTTLGTSTLAGSSAQLSTSSLAVGSHSITARYSGDSNFAGSTSSALTQTVNPVVSAGLAIDVQTSKDQGTAKSSVATAAFSTTAANELLLAFVATDYSSGSNTTVTSVTGGGLTWTLVLRSNQQSGTSEIWRAFAPSTLSNVTVTAALSHSVVSSLMVVSFTGVNTSGTNGSGAIGATTSTNASSGAPSATLVTTHNNSWVFGVGNDYDNAIARTPGPNQTVVHQDLAPVGDTYWVQRQNAPTLLSGTSVTINDTAPAGDRYNLAICEILPAQ